MFSNTLCSGLIKPDTNLGGKIATRRGVQWQDYGDQTIGSQRFQGKKLCSYKYEAEPSEQYRSANQDINNY
ncbi:MAG: hypothetical protein ACJAUG_001104 [Halioglobus sp.]|jgi:hypothetical protein